MKEQNLSVKRILITSFAMFSMIFGGGNFILPPLLGLKAADHWWIVSLAFGISGVIIPLLGIFIQAKIQGTMVNVGKKVHPIFGLIIGILMYAICLSFPIPRTGSVTYELAIEKNLPISSLWFGIIYFGAVMYLCFNRNKILNILGKYLTPILLGIILLIIFKAVLSVDGVMMPTSLENPFSAGLLEGYQTFDGIASIIIGGVIISSLDIDNTLDFNQKKKLTIYAGVISGLALFIIYTGFIYTGAILREHFPSGDISRADVLSGMSHYTLGQIGKDLLNISVSIACFTTAVGIITGAADFMKTIFKSDLASHVTIIVSCLWGVLVGQTGTDYIIAIAVPILILIYPIVVTLIFLNLVPKSWTSGFIFKVVVMTSFIFTVPDFLASLGINIGINEYLPLSSYNLAWLIPSFMVWGIAKLFTKNSR